LNTRRENDSGEPRSPKKGYYEYHQEKKSKARSPEG